jgi:hypothetical protein
MLEKKKGNFRVDKLRAILLYEANFNQNNKKLGRDMMYTVEQLQVVAKEQYIREPQAQGRDRTVLE